MPIHLVPEERCGHCGHIMSSHFEYYEDFKSEAAVEEELDVRYYHHHCRECEDDCG